MYQSTQKLKNSTTEVNPLESLTRDSRATVHLEDQLLANPTTQGT
jgi:hypothetical protein